MILIDVSEKQCSVFRFVSKSIINGIVIFSVFHPQGVIIHYYIGTAKNMFICYIYIYL